VNSQHNFKQNAYVFPALLSKRTKRRPSETQQTGKRLFAMQLVEKGSRRRKASCLILGTMLALAALVLPLD
jgi:hypothetical protein